MREIADLFKAIGEENRLRILNLLANRGDICVCDLMKVIEAPQGRVSRHLTALRHAGLVDQEREGTWVVYSLTEPRNDLHAALIACMRDHLPADKSLAADLRTFDKKRKSGALTRCSKECAVK